MLQEKTLKCAEGFRSVVEDLYFHLFGISPITFDRYGCRRITLTREAMFVGSQLSEVEYALRRYPTELDRLFSILRRIDAGIRETIA
jgi:hypothetical protein